MKSRSRFISSWIALECLAAATGCDLRTVSHPLTNATGGTGGTSATTGGGGSATTSDSGSSGSLGTTGSGGTTTTSSSDATACATPADCPGGETDCAARTCAGGVCGMVFAATGTPAASQVTGDCHVVICDGAGNAVSVIDDADPPSDGGACMFGVCQNGSSSLVVLPMGTSCGSGTICDGAGNCVDCLIDADCGAPTPCAAPRCVAGACSAEYAPAGTGDPGQVSGDCQRTVCDGQGGSTTLPDDTDLPADDGEPCTVEACSGGAPQRLPAADGTACNDGDACTKNDVCTAGVCGGTAYTCTATTCLTGVACDGKGGCTAGTKAATFTPCITDSQSGPWAPPGLNGGCFNGYCEVGCVVNGSFYAPGGPFPIGTAVCQYCPSSTALASSLYFGGCHSGGTPGQCDGAGHCILFGP